MNTKKINVGLSVSSIENAIKELKQIKSNIRNINRDFIKQSLVWIQNRADTYLDSTVYRYPNSANIADYWEIKQTKNGKGGNLAYELRNKNDVACFVEFGTGLVGDKHKHPLADELEYEYDKNNHNQDGWDFAFEYNGQLFIYKGFDGYEGKSFLYNAFFEYFHLGEYKRIYQEVYDSYIK